MIRTLIFGAIAGYVGKKLYDEGKLTEFKNDLTTRFNEAKVKLDEQSAQAGVSTDTSPMVSPTTSTARPLPN